MEFNRRVSMILRHAIYSQESQQSKPNFIPQVSDWYDIIGATVGVGSVYRSGGVSWANTAKFNIAEIDENFILRYNARSTYSIGFIGIQDKNLAGYMPNYSFYNNQTALQMRDDGFNNGPSGGAWNTSTIFEIKRENGIVTWHMDGVLKGTSAKIFTGAMKFGCSLYHLNIGALNIEIEYI